MVNRVPPRRPLVAVRVVRTAEGPASSRAPAQGGYGPRAWCSPSPVRCLRRGVSLLAARWPGRPAEMLERRVMANPEKNAAVAEITEHFRSAQAAYLTEYRGLTMAQMSELRQSLGRETTYAVVKNTLTKIAAKDAGVDGLEGWLSGPTAIAFIKGDPVEAAKGLRTFSRANPLLVIKGGLLEG